MRHELRQLHRGRVVEVQASRGGKLLLEPHVESLAGAGEGPQRLSKVASLHVSDEQLLLAEVAHEPELLVDADALLGLRVLGPSRAVELVQEASCSVGLARKDWDRKTDVVHGDSPYEMAARSRSLVNPRDATPEPCPS